MAATDAAIVRWAVGPAERDGSGTTGRAATVAAVLDELGPTVRRGRRTSLVLTGTTRPAEHQGGLTSACVPPGAAGTTVHVPRLCAALHHAATLLARAETDLALVAAELEDEPGRWLVVALRRLAESWSQEEPPVAVVRIGDDHTEADRCEFDVLRPGDLRRLLTDGCHHPRSAADHRPPTPVALPDISRRGQAVVLLPPPVPALPSGAPLATGRSAADEVTEGRRAGEPKGRGVALLFPGQGAQYPRMGAGLYGHDPVFTTTMDTFFALWGDGGDRLREEWLSDDPSIPLDDGSRTQALLFGVGYALGTMVRSWGVRPVALLGHSAGEMVAATLGGVFSLPAAVRLIRARVTEVLRTPPGGMLAVAASADELQPYLTLDPSGQVAIASVNAPRQTLLAGPAEALAVVQDKLGEQGYVCRLARARQAFHSPAMRGAALATRLAVEAARPGPPVDTVYSAYVGRKLDATTAEDPAFWTTQMADPVLFWPALDALLATGDLLLVEAGAGQGLTNLARQHQTVQSRASDVVALLPASPGTPEADRRSVLAAAARIRTEGHAPRQNTVDGTVASR
ncbi:acyltransferase domain-containing protein [Micromonospora sp. NPDC050187]|uniref:acyltransferase domain-containing protein n=1 Tax=Micromonospora sp. NPDC050187 TaxID=3364277 RepID=UPI00379EABCF